jgi:transposase InsO family protein
MRTDFVLDALEHALYDRQPGQQDALIHHSDSGSPPAEAEAHYWRKLEQNSEIAAVT